MNESLISIIMPVYNTEKYLERCLNSIVNQTYKNWELIAVNDGSTDNTLNILNKYAQKDNRIIVLEQENQGQSVARNKALDISKGKYICFVDSDDWVELNYLEELYASITNTNSELAICSFYFATDKDKKLGYKFRSDIIPLKKFKSKLIKEEIKSYLWSYIFRKNLFKDLKFKEGVLFEDSILFERLSKRISTDITVVDKPLYHYFLREGSSVHNNNLKTQIDKFNALYSRYNLENISEEDRSILLRLIIKKFLTICKFNNCETDRISNYLKIINSADKSVFIRARKLISKKQFLKFKLACNFPIIFKIFPKYCALKKVILKLFPQKRKNLLDNYSTIVI